MATRAVIMLETVIGAEATIPTLSPIQTCAVFVVAAVKMETTVRIMATVDQALVMTLSLMKVHAQTPITMLTVMN